MCGLGDFTGNSPLASRARVFPRKQTTMSVMNNKTITYRINNCFDMFYNNKVIPTARNIHHYNIVIQHTQSIIYTR